MLVSGISMIECIKAKLKLLSMREGLSSGVANTNNASMIERASVAINSLLITGDDLDQVVCLICGFCPKILCSDGNSKDTISITKNLIYDFERGSEEIEVPELQEFKTRLAKQMLRSSFFQHEKKEDFDMLRIPVIMPPKLLKCQVNSDAKKKTLFNLETSYDAENLAALSQLIRKKQLDILHLGKPS